MLLLSGEGCRVHSWSRLIHAIADTSQGPARHCHKVKVAHAHPMKRGRVLGLDLEIARLLRPHGGGARSRPPTASSSVSCPFEVDVKVPGSKADFSFL